MGLIIYVSLIKKQLFLPPPSSLIGQCLVSTPRRLHPCQHKFPLSNKLERKVNIHLKGPPTKFSLLNALLLFTLASNIKKLPAFHLFYLVRNVSPSCNQNGDIFVHNRFIWFHRNSQHFLEKAEAEQKLSCMFTIPENP